MRFPETGFRKCTFNSINLLWNISFIYIYTYIYIYIYFKNQNGRKFQNCVNLETFSCNKQETLTKSYLKYRKIHLKFYENQQLT